MNLADIRTNVKLMLGMAAGSELSNAEIARAMNMAVGVLSRYFPRELVYTFVYNQSVSTETVTLSSSTQSFANKPVKFGSEVVKNDGETVTYTRNTNYEMDYTNGVITAISGIGASDPLKVTYDMDPTMIDLGSNLTEPIAVRSVQTISNNLVPRKWDGFDVWGDFLLIKTDGIHTQGRLLDNEHVRIYYDAYHTEPGESSEPTYPAYLTELVLLGTAGYSLLIEAQEQEHDAVAITVAANTVLTDIAHAAYVLDIGDANTALDVVHQTVRTGTYSLMKALDDAGANLVLAAAEIDKYDSAEQGTTQANLEFDKVQDLIDDFSTVIGNMTAYITGDTQSQKESLDRVQAETDIANSALDSTNSTISAMSTSFNAGYAKINTINTARDAATEYRRYAETKLAAAQVYVQAASGRVAHANAIMTEARGWFSVIESLMTQAGGRLSEANSSIELGDAFLREAGLFLSAGMRYTENALAYVQIAQGRWWELQAFLREAELRISMANTEVAFKNSIISQTLGNQRTAQSLKDLALQMKSEANDLLASFFISCRQESGREGSAQTATSQYARYD